jgi:23S rRNA (guanine745-N1)-methyltransferase
LSKTNKRINAAKFVSNYESIFICPICHSNMSVIECKSLICENNHTFDFTKQGYLNLTTHSMKTKYSKELFEARRNLITEIGFFNPLIMEITNIINNHNGINSNELFVLDTGCGEGSHLSNICDAVTKTTIGVGIDLAKEGIMVASKNYSKQIWTVADLASTPFKDQQFDVILNILSPSNYAEFNRLLKNDGLVIKIVPQSGYLKELREAFFEKSQKETYSNEETVELFSGNFQLIKSTRISYTMTLEKSSLQSLIKMTPLTWSSKEEQINSFLAKNQNQITVDLEILIGEKK